jgi:hypothetical protein
MVASRRSQDDGLAHCANGRISGRIRNYFVPSVCSFERSSLGVFETGCPLPGVVDYVVAIQCFTAATHSSIVLFLQAVAADNLMTDPNDMVEERPPMDIAVPILSVCAFLGCSSVMWREVGVG